MLEVRGLAKSFVTDEGAVRAVDDVSFSVAEAQCCALLGPSGCGKTSILRCVAGLERADRGTISIGGRVVSDADSGIFVPVHERPIGMVFQSYAIWPHLDVYANVAYPLDVQRPRLAASEIDRRVMDVLTLVGMQTMARRPATRLSGGQQQRVALARAIVRRPSLLLLDEPLSNLDARLRDAMRRELSMLIRQIGITALFVTHDQIEALSLADNVAVMRDGRIVQEGAPADIYDKPRNLFVAQFLGAANVLSGKIEANDGRCRARHARCRRTCPDVEDRSRAGDRRGYRAASGKFADSCQPSVRGGQRDPRQDQVAGLPRQQGRIRCRYRLGGVAARAVPRQRRSRARSIGVGRDRRKSHGRFRERRVTLVTASDRVTPLVPEQLHPRRAANSKGNPRILR